MPSRIYRGYKLVVKPSLTAEFVDPSFNCFYYEIIDAEGNGGTVYRSSAIFNLEKAKQTAPIHADEIIDRLDYGGQTAGFTSPRGDNE